MIIGTAGHIDHGKSALVTALTGIAVDRLAEERRRGITIDLNFAPLVFPGLPPAGIIDVPGHEDFVRTMVAGASGIDLVLLVVDLVEGPRPQTEEHLAIVEQLRIPRGIPVFTKADLVEPDWIELVVADFEARLTKSPVEFDRGAIVSAVTGQGLGDLKDRLRNIVATAGERSRKDLFRLPVDRVFSVAGTGTVATGTAWTGAVAINQAVRVLPADLMGRVRSIESYGQALERSVPRTRTAIGLAGVDRASLNRGDVLVGADEPWRPTSALDVEIELLPGCRPLRPRTRLRAHLGTAEILARVHPREPIEPGGRGRARLSLEAPTIARGGDRFVIRTFSPVTTIGGGRVLDPLPPRKAEWPAGLSAVDPILRLEALVARRLYGLPVVEGSMILGEPPADLHRIAERARIFNVGGRWVLPAVLDRLRADAVSSLEEFHRAQPSEPGMSHETLRARFRRLPETLVEEVIRRLAHDGSIVVREGVVARAGFTPLLPGGEQALDRLTALLDEAGLEPPNVDQVAHTLGLGNPIPWFKKAQAAGSIVAVERDRYYSRSAIDRFTAALERLGARGPITPAQLREELGSTRKFLIPLLEWADRQGVTRREGDVRLLVQKGRG